jgi:hypothetical protein
MYLSNKADLHIVLYRIYLRIVEPRCWIELIAMSPRFHPYGLLVQFLLASGFLWFFAFLALGVYNSMVLGLSTGFCCSLTTVCQNGPMLLEIKRFEGAVIDIQTKTMALHWVENHKAAYGCVAILTKDGGNHFRSLGGHALALGLSP